MSLAHPALSTTGRKRGKQKFASAEAARKHRELTAEWERKQAEWQAMSKQSASAAKVTKIVSPVATSNIRQTERGSSLNSWITGPVSSKPNQQYTGSNICGIAVQHKSCLQPVFNKQEAIESATMRRG